LVKGFSEFSLFKKVPSEGTNGKYLVTNGGIFINLSAVFGLLD